MGKCLFMHHWFVEEVHVGGETLRCATCGETRLKITNADLARRTDIAEAMSGMTIRFFTDDGPLTQFSDSGLRPYGVGLSCGCVYPLELEFDPPLGVLLPCPQHGDKPFEVIAREAPGSALTTCDLVA